MNSLSKENSAKNDQKLYIGLHVKCPLFPSYLNENLNFLDRFSEKIFKYKFHENPSTGSRGVPFGRTDVRKLAVVPLNVRLFI